MSQEINKNTKAENQDDIFMTADESLEEKGDVSENRPKPARRNTTMMKRRKRNKLKRRIIISAAVGVLLLLIIYMVGFLLNNGKFLANTYIWDVDCSGMTIEEAEKAVADYKNEYKLELVEVGGASEYIKGTDVDLEIDVENKLDKILEEQNAFLWFTAYFDSETHVIDAAVTYDKDKLLTSISELKVCDTEGMIEPTDAFVAFDEAKNEYYIDPGVAGTVILPQELEAAVSNAIGSLVKKLDLKEANCYKMQEITADSKEIKEQLELVKEYGIIKVTLVFGENKEVIDISKMADWLVKENDKIYADSKAVTEYVASLAEKYDTVEKDRTLHTTYGFDITVEKGDYGWEMNQAATADKIAQAISEGGEHEFEPEWTQTANAFGAADWGNTYIEVNLTKQHLYYYKDGQLVVESDFVSGTVSKARSTPTGIYYIKYKKSPSILRGINWETPVTYWLPFFDGCGLHDATWRSKFGGTIYYYDGSHGCLNMPMREVRTIYENISAGVPILIYKTEVEPVKVVPVHETPWPSGYPTAVPTETPVPTEVPVVTDVPVTPPPVVTDIPVVTAVPTQVPTEVPVNTAPPVEGQ